MRLRTIQKTVLLFCIVTTGFCGMVAEFSVSTLTSYLMGNTIASWSVTIVLMMAAMAGGGLLTSRIKDDGQLMGSFVKLELLLSFVCSAVVLFIYNMDLYEWTELAIGLSCVMIGMLIGAEIPILSRIMNAYGLVYKKNIPWVLAGDYIGSLVGGFAFAYFFVPKIGLVYTPIILGATNAVVAFAMFLALLPALAPRIDEDPWEHYVHTAGQGTGNTTSRRVLAMLFAVAGLWLTAAFLFSPTIMMYATQELYDDPIVFEMQTPYQQITITRGVSAGAGEPLEEDIRLFLNGGLQFSSLDEYRYHEALVHPAMVVASAGQVRALDVLILGGGDGLAVREVRKHALCDAITVVDLDEAMTSFFSGDCTQLSEDRGRKACEMVARLNEYAFSDPRVVVVNQDAFSYLKKAEAQPNHRFDVIIIDLPDPYSVEINKLYTREFFRLVKRHLARRGALAIQSTSPYHAREAFLCINKTLAAAGFSVVPYWVNVPSFGEWGFNLGAHREVVPEQQLKRQLEQAEISVATRWLNQAALQGAIRFGKDVFVGFDRIAVNTLVEPRLIDYYHAGWEDE